MSPKNKIYYCLTYVALLFCFNYTFTKKDGDKKFDKGMRTTIHGAAIDDILHHAGGSPHRSTSNIIFIKFQEAQFIKQTTMQDMQRGIGHASPEAQQHYASIGRAEENKPTDKEVFAYQAYKDFANTAQSNQAMYCKAINAIVYGIDDIILCDRFVMDNEQYSENAIEKKKQELNEMQTHQQWLRESIRRIREEQKFLLKEVENKQEQETALDKKIKATQEALQHAAQCIVVKE